MHVLISEYQGVLVNFDLEATLSLLNSLPLSVASPWNVKSNLRQSHSRQIKAQRQRVLEYQYSNDLKRKISLNERAVHLSLVTVWGQPGVDHCPRQMITGQEDSDNQQVISQTIRGTISISFSKTQWIS